MARPTTVRPVRFPDGELEAVVAAAAAAGLTVNAWVRRACRGAAEMERSIALEAEAAVPPSHAELVAMPRAQFEQARREFTPDFGKRLRP
jgi:hypothetical protein